MQLTNKAKIASAAVVAGALTVGLVAAQSSRPTVESAVAQAPKAQQLVVAQQAKQLEQSDRGKRTINTSSLAISANPIDPKAAKDLRDQAIRRLTVEKQARQFLKERRFDEAEKACYSALALSHKWKGQPMASSTFQLLGDIYREQGRYQDALDSYFKARQHTRNWELDFGIALSYLKLGNVEKARKFYSEPGYFKSRVEKMTPAQTSAYLSMLPGTKTPKAMEASILYAWGSERSGFAEPEEAVNYFRKSLELFPQNALAAHDMAWALGFLGRNKESVPYWARVAVFGQGDMAKEGRVELNRRLMPDKAEQVLRDAKKIRG